MTDSSDFDTDDVLDASSLNSDEDYEEISSDEVDRVVEALETLMATVDSENIRYFLEEATNSIYLLIYDDNEPAASEAA
jgi:uncharacterized FlaG/YvyC family protein